MKNHVKLRSLLGVFLVVVFSLGAGPCDRSVLSEASSQGDERLIVLLQTNDIHGGIEPRVDAQGKRTGGLAVLSGIVHSIRQGIGSRKPELGGVLLLDGGDQFQGTLISNYSEGLLAFENMNRVGYDAAVPGNHAYDFGPQGWLEDRVTPGGADQNPRGVIEKLVASARFPLLSANTWLRSSLFDIAGRAVEVASEGCAPLKGPPVLDYSRIVIPSFLKPYLIKEVAGVKVAVIGLDSALTAKVTTGVNVEDLCFADPAETYLRVREEIGAKADVFVAVIHEGNGPSGATANHFAEKVGSRVDAVLAAHTHMVHKDRVGGVPVVQSGANGQMFGRVDLVFNSKTRRVDQSRTLVYAGLAMADAACPPSAERFCSVDPVTQRVVYEGVETRADSEVVARIAEAKAQLMEMAGKKLGEAMGKLWVDRIRESPLANAATDWLRVVSGADIALMNTGGLRTAVAKGDFNYEVLYSVLPFNNRGVVLAPMPLGKILKLLERSAQSCGAYGALMQSGLKVTYERTCIQGQDTDPSARLLRVETAAGEVLSDVASGKQADPNRTFSVATLDFLADGGSGYDDFKGVPLRTQLGIVREMFAHYLGEDLKGELKVAAALDGRFREVPRTIVSPGLEGRP